MLIVVRHGRTDANARGLLLGRADPGLDDTGRGQVDRLADSLGPVDRVISSPLRRCRETAAAFGGAIEVDERWIELDYGDYDGMATAAVPSEVWASWRRDLDFAPPNGESLTELALRVRAALEALTTEDLGRIVVVTHVSPIKVALAWALGVTDEISWRAYVAPCSVMTIDVSGRTPVLRSFNETGHLES